MLIFGDFVVQKVILEALEKISNDSSVLEALFVELKKDYFLDTYGQSEIEEIRKYFETKKIKVVNAFTMVEQNVPTYSIQLLQNREITAEASLGDFLETEFIGDDEEIDMYPSSLEYPKVDPEFDSKNEVFGTPIQESVTIGCFGRTPNAARYMSWILHYILRSNLNTFINRGLDRLDIGFTDFTRQNDRMPENVYARFCTLTYVHYLSFKKKANLLECDYLTVKTTAQVESTENSPGTTDVEDINSTVNTEE